MKKNNILPGFNISLTYICLYIFLIIIIPLSLLFAKIFSMSIEDYIRILSEARTLESFKNSFICGLIASFINILIGTLIGWVLSKYQFYGKKIIDLMIDIPYALPSAVSGIVLTHLYASNGIMGGILAKFNIKATYNHLGIIIALIFVNLPITVRSMENAINNLPLDIEEAAKILGANDTQIFTKITLPNILPSMISGFIISFARSIGEYGAVIFISGNIPYFSEMISHIIVIKLEEYDYQSALVIASFLLIVSFILLFLTNLFQRKNSLNITKR